MNNKKSSIMFRSQVIAGILSLCGFLAWAMGASAEEAKPSPEAKAPAPPKVRAVAGLRVGFMAYWQSETEMVIKAANLENHRRVDAACAALHPLSFTQGGAAAVPERARVALEKGDVDALLICMWASYPPRWYGRVGERSSLSELAALGAKNNKEFRILWHAFLMPDFDKPTADGQRPTLNVKRSKESLIAQRKQLEAEVDGVNARLGRRVAWIVPVADAGLALMDEVAAGKFPGIKDAGELFMSSAPTPKANYHEGGWGPGRHLIALAAYCHYATLYRSSPEGLEVPFPEFKTKPKGAPAEISLGKLTAAENEILQRIAWETVSKYSYSATTTPTR